MHKNNPTYCFLFEGFNLWKHVLFKYVETDNPSNGALTKSRPSFSMTLYNGGGKQITVERSGQLQLRRGHEGPGPDGTMKSASSEKM